MSESDRFSELRFPELLRTSERLLWNELNAAQRPFGESTSEPFYEGKVELRQGVARFQDSREGMVTNISALSEIMDSWPEVLEIAAKTGCQIARRVGRPCPNLLGLWMAGRAGVDYTFNEWRRVGRKSAEMGPRPTVAFKTHQGLHLIADYAAPHVDCTETLTAERAFEIGDRFGALFNHKKGRACAGPTARIVEFLKGSLEGLGSEAANEQADEDAYYRICATIVLLHRQYWLREFDMARQLVTDERARSLEGSALLGSHYDSVYSHLIRVYRSTTSSLVDGAMELMSVAPLGLAEDWDVSEFISSEWAPEPLLDLVEQSMLRHVALFERLQELEESLEKLYPEVSGRKIDFQDMVNENLPTLWITVAKNAGVDPGA